MSSLKWGQRLDNLCDCRMKRWILLVAAVIEVIFFGGYHYGMFSLMASRKIFRSDCRSTETMCESQNKMISYAFIFWIVMQTCLITGAGIIMDRFGLRLLKIIAVFLQFAGTLMFAFSEGDVGWLIFPAGVLLAVGSTSSLICNHQISSMFFRYKGLAISLMSGAFESSTVVPYIIQKLNPVISAQNSFLTLAFSGLAYGAVMSMFGMTQWSVSMGKKNSPTNMESANTDKEKMDLTNINCRIQNILNARYPRLRQCLFSVPFCLVTVWFMLGLVQFSFTLARSEQLLKHWFPEKPIDEYKEEISLITMGGFIAAPLSALLIETFRAIFLEKMKKLCIQETGCYQVDNDLYWLLLCGIAPAFLVMSSASLIMSAVGFAKGIITYYIFFLLFVVMRSLLFSASVSYIAIAFPVQHFGVVLGVMNTIGGILSLIQYGLVELSVIPANCVAVIISLTTFVVPLFILVKRCVPFLKTV